MAQVIENPMVSGYGHWDEGGAFVCDSCGLEFEDYELTEVNAFYDTEYWCAHCLEDKEMEEQDEDTAGIEA